MKKIQLVKRSKNRYKKVNSMQPINEDGVILSSAKIASSKAIRSSMAMGITIKVIKNHEILEISPDKSIKFIRKIAKSTIDVSVLKKGMLLERK